MARSTDALPWQTDKGSRDLLVPFDGSQGATKALRRACRTARRDGDGVTVLCIVTLQPGDAARDERGLGRTAMAALARAQALCREEGVVGVFLLRAAGDPAAAIVEEARRIGAVLICMGLDEYAGCEVGGPAPMSTTAEAVLACAPCSVLLENPDGRPLLDVERRPA